MKRGRAKLEIALAKGKDAPDKRKTVKEREQKKQAQRRLRILIDCLGRESVL